MKKVLLFSGKNKDVMFGVDFMNMWFWGNTRLSETDEKELKLVYNLFFSGRNNKSTREARNEY